MVIFARNVPSEAGLDCPLCDKKYKVRTTKKHVKDVHSKSLLYKCVYPLAGGEVCKYSCGKRISCFINHQRRTHNLKFEEMAAHRYDITTHFVVEVVEASEDVHSFECLRETKVFNDETMRVARKKYNEKLKASKPATDEDKSETSAPESERKSKRKAEDDTLAKDVKKGRKEEEVKNTHAESTLPQSENVDGSTHAEESADDKEVIPEDTGIDEDFHEEFNAQQGELSDSEDEEEGGEVTKKLEPELMYQVGGGRFAKDLHGLCKGVQAEMVRGYSTLKNNPPAWRKVVNRLRNTWHPDKNDVVFKRKSEEVFKFIENEKKRLESME